MMKNIHVIVGAGSWSQDGLRYRRHRLAEFLASCRDTERVIWLCPAPHRQTDHKVGAAQRIEQWTVTDLLPQKAFRFSRYVPLFHQRRLKQLVHRLQIYEGRFHLYLWYTFPGFPSLSNLLHWDRVVYDRSDLWAAPISGQLSLARRMRRRVIAQSEQQIVARADLIFCTSDYLHHVTDQELPVAKQNRVRTFENGVDYALFEAGGKPQKNARIVLGYMGGIKPKLDFALLDAVACRKPDWTILLVGPDSTHDDPKFNQLRARPNVTWVDAVPADQVPHYMQQVTIGLMPYKASPYNYAVFPLKLFEFLASGKAAVGIHLPSTKKYEQEGSYLCLDQSDPELLIRTCERLARVADDPVYIQQRKAVAKAKDWPTIFETMLHHVIID